MILQTMEDWLLSKLQKLVMLYVDAWPGTWRNLLVAICIVAAILLIECVAVGWKASSLRKILAFKAGTKNDLVSTALTLLQVSSLIGLVMSFGAVYLLLKFTKGLIGMHFHIGLESALAAAVLYYLLIDFSSYWIHRWHHIVPCLWELHKYHHSAPEMNVLNKYRNHPLYDMTASIGAIPLLLVDAPVDYVFSIGVAMQIHTLLLHSNIQKNWGWVGRWLIFSPAAHRVHHSKSEEHYDKNFGSLLPIWDYLFGTLKYPTIAECVQIQIGLNDDAGTKPPVKYLFSVYFNFLKSVMIIFRRKKSKTVDI